MLHSRRTFKKRKDYVRRFLKFCLRQQLFAFKEFCMETRLFNIFKTTNVAIFYVRSMEEIFRYLKKDIFMESSWTFQRPLTHESIIY